MATAMTVCVFPHYVAPAIQLADGGQSMVALHESIPIRMTSESTAQDYTIDTNVYSHMVAEDLVTSANLIDAATCDRFRTNSKKVANPGKNPDLHYRLYTVHWRRCHYALQALPVCITGSA